MARGLRRETGTTQPSLVVYFSRTVDIRLLVHATIDPFKTVIVVYYRYSNRDLLLHSQYTLTPY